MAQPNNSHHVHGDGYYTERDDSMDPEQMMYDLADELVQHDGVVEVLPDGDPSGPYISVEVESDSVADTVRETANGWGCTVAPLDDEWLEVRYEPE